MLSRLKVLVPDKIPARMPCITRSRGAGHSFWITSRNRFVRTKAGPSQNMLIKRIVGDMSL